MAHEYAVPVYNEENLRENFTSVEFTTSARFFFEVLMLTLRRETISYGIRKKKEEQREEKELEFRIHMLERNLTDTIDDDIIEQLETKRKQLEKLREKRLKGNIVRPRAIWREYSEKPSKYVLSLEKRRYESKRIPCIKTKRESKETRKIL